MSGKVAYVREQAASKPTCPEVHPLGYPCSKDAGHTGNHTPKMAHHCHWPGCDKDVPPAMWGCKPHWFRLPLRLRNQIWATYRPGQEISKTPSEAYVRVAQEVQAWIAAGEEGK
jgi:hypothetical protein